MGKQEIVNAVSEIAPSLPRSATKFGLAPRERERVVFSPSLGGNYIPVEEQYFDVFRAPDFAFLLLPRFFWFSCSLCVCSVSLLLFAKRGRTLMILCHENSNSLAASVAVVGAATTHARNRTRTGEKRRRGIVSF